jgi:decaprenylphospho-beta-D-ribofuranose 2-oxidase
MRMIKHTGWGRTHSSSSKCYEIDEINQSLFDENSNGLAIGLGRSYGDTSVNSNGLYIRLGSTKKIEIDLTLMTATCSANVTIGELERASIKKNLFLPTVPGTEFVTIGGAVASNIHGKSHHISGSFGQSVLEISLLKSSNEIVKLYPNGETSKFFWATVGGLGLTGVIIEVKIKLERIETTYVTVEEKRAGNLKELINLINDFDTRFQYTVAWIDLSGDYSGKGIVSGANHAGLNSLSKRKQRNPNKIKFPKKINLPDFFPSWFINRKTVSLFNLLWYKKPLVQGVKHIQPFLHPLDSVLNWNRIYGKSGFVQFQFQVSDNNLQFITEILNLMKQYRVVSFLGVLKKFGVSDKSYLGFPSPGWTLAIDVPAKKSDFIKELQNQMPHLIEIKGRVYLTKDSILSESQFQEMYPSHREWNSIKNELDPKGFWQSDQGRRLGLC